LWCTECHHGSEAMQVKPGSFCTQCGSKMFTRENPFQKKSPQKAQDGEEHGRRRKKADFDGESGMIRNNVAYLKDERR